MQHFRRTFLTLSKAITSIFFIKKQSVMQKSFGGKCSATTYAHVCVYVYVQLFACVCVCACACRALTLNSNSLSKFKLNSRLLFSHTTSPPNCFWLAAILSLLLLFLCNLRQATMLAVVRILKIDLMVSTFIHSHTHTCTHKRNGVCLPSDFTRMQPANGL